MPDPLGDFITLLRAGKIDAARALIETEQVNSQYSPDMISTVEGEPPRFTRRGKPVELGDDGIWRAK